MKSFAPASFKASMLALMLSSILSPSGALAGVSLRDLSSLGRILIQIDGEEAKQLYQFLQVEENRGMKIAESITCTKKAGKEGDEYVCKQLLLENGRAEPVRVYRPAGSNR